MDGWKRFEDSEFGVHFTYPDPSPLSQRLTKNSRLTHVHLSSPESDEIYFELTCYTTGLDPSLGRRNLIEENSKRFKGFKASPLQDSQMAGLHAQSFVFSWNEGSRQVIFIELKPQALRIIFDPESNLNHQILSSIQLIGQ